MSLKIKLLSAFIVVALFSAIVGGINYIVLKDVVHKSDHVSQINLGNAVTLGKLLESARGLQVKMWQFIGDKHDESTLKKITQEVEELAKIYVDTDKIYQGIPFVEGEQELYDAQNNAWLKTFEDIKKLKEMAQAAKLEEMQVYISQTYMVNSDLHLKNLKVLFEFQNDQGNKWSKDAQDTAQKGFKYSFLAVILGFAIAAVIGIVTANKLASTLHSISKELAEGAEYVSNESTDVAAASTQLSESSAEQAASLQETVSSIDEVSAMVANNAENSKKSQVVSEENQGTATTGKQVVDSMMTAISEISHSNDEIMKQVDENNKEMSEIVKLINEIGDKTKVINDIVFQTKLLSFNASVEAARAGEHGKGFAVVAEEVGNLATMSGNAAKEITQLLDTSIKRVESIVEDSKKKAEIILKTGQEKIVVGQNTAERCREVLDQIYQKSFSVNEMMKEINHASNEQSVGVSEISKAMNQLNSTIQQNTSAAQLCASSSENLRHQSETLNQIVQRLQYTISGQKTVHAPGVPQDSHRAEVRSNSKPSSHSQYKAAA